MKPELINQLHSNLQNIDRQLEEISEEWQRLEQKWHSVLSDWEQKVVAIGKALIEFKAEHGKGWKRDYSSFGFDFSYGVACRYIACAEHPDARGDTNSVEEWANIATEISRASNETETAREARRIKRAEARTRKEAVNLAAYDEQEPDAVTAGRVAANYGHLKSEAQNCCLKDQMQESFDLLNEAIVSDPRLEQLRPYWQRLCEGLEQGLVPRIRAVSPDRSDDTVETGGVEIAIDRKAELLNA